MIRLTKTVKDGMLHRVVKPVDAKAFQAIYNSQYQLDVMRKAILGKAGAMKELQSIEEARYGYPKK